MFLSRFGAGHQSVDAVRARVRAWVQTRTRPASFDVVHDAHKRTRTRAT